MDDKDYWRSERVAFLALCQLKGVGYWTLYKWSAANISFKDVLRDPAKFGVDKAVAAAANNADNPVDLIWRQGLALARRLASMSVVLIFKGEPEFPQRLREIADGPSWIFVQGAVDNLYGAIVGIVGAREPSLDGIFLARVVVAALHGIKLSTVSGLALGIDQVAHVESLNCKIPTIAVLGTGILENYPKNSIKLRQSILDSGGTIVTEYLPSQSHSAENFVRRNRIQAALSDVLIPVEWKVKSGTAHTVRYAKAYGKRVMGVLLPYHDPATPEAIFIEQDCGGMMFTLPRQSETMFNIISALSDSDASIDIGAVARADEEREQSVSVEEGKSQGVDDESLSSESGQLPLI
ncbi:DNA-protecting protein DprA [Pseudomonas aeruginosa]|uniref:DNA-processing protein DprA n=1 Tax=Pseudomonas aeruginosa TaxID=287 RepID=UPI00228BF2C9|nr:DNA-processing protein DprA [Pseudomonas aeruginosa]MDI2265068.1 DNA-protecting protein DprA [Pseudomonas aeruginosa]MDI2276239.1 DNA-protecting protein DprA [Pseudomonas aeruginosa]MDI2288937.1 DNA-protecting protein DprA [Pseudomonas aeruginosa]HCU0831861.1 DNA-protecting protein DprA [Pseudomonas aeruginosa]